jgi:hypothetical protein
VVADSVMGQGADHGCSSCAPTEGLGRRRFMELLALGLAAALTGCGLQTEPEPAASPVNTARTSPVATASSVSSTTTATTPARTIGVLPPIPDPNPGSPRVFWHAPTNTQRIALTIDDGSCQPCVQAYVDFAQHRHRRV